MIYMLNMTSEDFRRITGTDAPPVFARLSVPNGESGPRFFGAYLRQKDSGVEMRIQGECTMEAVQYIAERLRRHVALAGE